MNLRSKGAKVCLIKGAKVCLLLLIVGLILWAKHAGLFVASFREGFIFN